MKKGWPKKILCAGLALAMAVSLPACGRKKDVNAGLAKEHVYKYQELAFPDLGRDFNVMGTVRKDGAIYVMVRVYHWNDEEYTGNDMDVKVIAMKEDGSDLTTVTLQIPDNNNASGGISVPIGARPLTSSTIRTAVSSAQLPAVAPAENGTDAEAGSDTENGSDAEAGSDTENGSGSDADSAAADSITVDVDVDVDDTGKSNVWENEYTNFNNYTIGADGLIYGIKSYTHYYDDYDNPENSFSTRKKYLYAWNPDGSFRRETELEGLETEEEYCYISFYTVDAEGNANMVLSGDNIYKMTVDAKGTQSEKTKMPDDMDKVFSYMDSMIDKGDGEFLVVYRDENEWQKQFIIRYNMNTGMLGEPKELPASFSWSGYNCIAAGTSSDLVYSTSLGLYSLNGGDAQSVMKMDFINSDMNIYGFDSVVELDENRFLGIFSEAFDGSVHAGIFTYVRPEDIKDKSVLVLAGMWVNGNVRQRVVEFNRSNEEYRIVVRTYEEYNSYEDSNAGVTQLNNDIISGNMPDILIAADLSTDHYAAKGLLADIGEMIDKDEELSKVEFMTNVFESYSRNGKLFYVIPRFYARTMVGKTALVGDRDTWTMKDMRELMATLPEGTNLLSELTRDEFFNTAMSYCGSDFVDVETGKCNFNSEGFIDLMEYARTLPEQLGKDYFGEDYWENYESQYRDNRTVLCQLYINRLSQINYVINGSFGEPVSYIGFPTESGQGAYIDVPEEYAISAKSRHKDVAWEFLRYYLTDEYQSELTYGLPIQRKYFMEKAQEATQRPYWVNPDGEKEEYDETFWMNGEVITIPPMSQEQLDAVVAMIESITKHPYVNEDVMNIINEDMGAFFSGQKSAQEVADVIQNRVQLYVDENG